MTVDSPLTCYICGKTEDRATIDLYGCLMEQGKAKKRLKEKFENRSFNGFIDVCPSCEKKNSNYAKNVYMKYGVLGDEYQVAKLIFKKILKESYEHRELARKELEKYSGHEKILKFISNKKNCPKQILGVLADSAHVNIRASVAQNHNTSGETLEKLADDDSPYVRLRLACNPNCPKESFKKAILAYSEKESQFKGIGKKRKSILLNNPNTPPEVLEELNNLGY